MLVVFAAIFKTANALAFDRKGTFFVRPAVGYYYPADKRSLDSSTLPAISIGYDFEDKWGASFGINVINTMQKPSIGGASVHGFIYTLDAIYRFDKLKQFNPYVMFGPQVTSIKPATGSDPVTQGGASFGVGATHYFSSSIGLSFEVRDSYTFSGGKNDVLVNAGVVFLFGGNTGEDK